MTDTSCPACAGRWPSLDQRIAELRTTVAYLHDDQFFPGWTVLVLKRHATELFDLSIEERSALVDDVARGAQVVAVEFQAIKMNYALLGNLIPHIHWHLIPRQAGDPSPRDPVWSVPHEPVSLGAEERNERIARIRRRLMG